MGVIFPMSPRRKQPEEPSDTDQSDSPFSEPIVVPIEDAIDLHAFSPKEIPSVVEEYIEQCVQAGIYEVRIIHGRGTGVQRKIVQSMLKKNPLVASFKDAPAELGGWGATVVVLRK
jgi:dsDNA-specific endonuclease/ATPase MutS2